MEDNVVRVRASRYETIEHGHGRDEHRTYIVCDVPDDLPDRARWKGLKRIGVAISDTMRGDKACDDVRYYISSRRLNARSFGAAVRGRWSIENSLHWQLDMSFGEDRSRIRKGHADANFAVIRRMALTRVSDLCGSG
jgi:predicted transposase YbfD/YdcC